MLLVGGVVRTHQQHHHPPTTPTHPPVHSHPATNQGFFADTHRLTVTAIIGHMLEHRNNEKIANAVADKEILLVGDVVVRTQ